MTLILWFDRLCRVWIKCLFALVSHSLISCNIHHRGLIRGLFNTFIRSAKIRVHRSVLYGCLSFTYINDFNFSRFFSRATFFFKFFVIVFTGIFIVSHIIEGIVSTPWRFNILFFLFFDVSTITLWCSGWLIWFCQRCIRFRSNLDNVTVIFVHCWVPVQAFGFLR